MHTFKHADTVFNFNGDFSGNVLIACAGRPSMEVPFEALKTFIEEYGRRKQVEAEEDAFDRQSL